MDMSDDRPDTPHHVPSGERPSWEPPTLTYHGRLAEIVMGGGKPSGAVGDPGIDSTRKPPPKPPAM
jgi:hypothetical protein